MIIAGEPGVAAQEVEGATRVFESELQRRVESVDQRIPAHAQPSTDDELDEVIELAAWAHAEWVRIHPFANGNGRTARMWANYVLVRYGVPPLMRLRPRPNGAYGDAAAAAMHGRVSPTISFLKDSYDEWEPAGG